MEAKKLLEKFCPAIFKQISKAKIDWDKVEQTFQAQYSDKENKHVTTVFTLSKKAELGDKFAISFLKFINELVEESEIIVPFKKKFREMLQGKINNADGWNYLNPIGELAVLKKLLASGFTLIAMEDRTRYPELSPKDFLFKNPDGKEWLIEVLNIHLDEEDYYNIETLKRKLLGAVTGKINKETSGIKPGNPTTLAFLPVLWHADLVRLKQYKSYFADFAKSFGQSDQHHFPVVGYCAFGKIGEQFHFGEVSSFFNEQRYRL